MATGSLLVSPKFLSIFFLFLAPSMAYLLEENVPDIGATYAPSLVGYLSFSLALDYLITQDFYAGIIGALNNLSPYIMFAGLIAILIDAKVPPNAQSFRLPIKVFVYGGYLLLVASELIVVIYGWF